MGGIMSTPNEADLDALAAGAIDDADLRALARVAQLYERLDPPPPGLVERVTFGITLDALHAEIAEIQRSGDLVGVRSENTTDAQTVTFTSATLTLMVTISALAADRVRIDGWAAPGGGVRIELRSADGTSSQTADADGRFVFADAPRGFAQFVVRQPGDNPAPAVITPSIEL
jgi:hypothetical protein